MTTPAAYKEMGDMQDEMLKVTEGVYKRREI
jgi:hypothetical protein